MFDWYTTMNQPDWDGRTYAFPQPMGAAPVQPLPQGNPMQRPQATNEMLPQGSVSGGLLGKLAEDGGEEQATPRMPSPFGPKQEQGEAAPQASEQPRTPQANPLTAPASGPLAGPVMQPQMMPQQPMPMAAPYGWGQPLPQMAGQGTAFAQAGKTGEDKGVLGKFDPGALALFAGLSMLGNNTGGRTFGQLVGKAGFDALAGAGGMAAAQAAAERQKRKDDREDMTTRIAQHKIDLERYKLAQEAAGMQALQGYLGGGAGGGMGGMMPSRTTLGGAYTGAALAPEVDGWIVKYSQEYGVDPNIVRAVVMQESGGRQDVVSPAGAIGYGQLTLDTAKGLGVDPYDPEQNIKGTVMYLGQMRDRYGGNWDRALYAYNWGPGNMDAYLKTGKGLNGQPMPSETLNYVPGVRSRLSGGQQPAVAGGYGGGGGGRLTIPTEALLLPGKAGEVARTLYAQNKPASTFDNVNSLGKRWMDESADYLGRGQSLEKLLSGAKQQSAAGDITMVFNFMKMNDPNSAVLPGEYATAQNAGGVDERVRAFYNSLLDGQRLTPSQRKDFLTTAKAMFESAIAAKDERARHFTSLAQAYGIDPSLVIYDPYASLSNMVDAFIAEMDVPSDAVQVPAAGGGNIPGVNAGSAGAQNIIQYDKNGNRVK